MHQIVITGAGVLSHLGDDLNEIENLIREGKSKPFVKYAPAVELNGRCQIVGLYDGDLSDDALKITKSQSRFLGKQSRLGLKAARIALADAKYEGNDFAVIVGTGTGDTQTHIDIETTLRESRSMRQVSPTVVPRIMASTVSANLSNILQARGPSFSVSAACAGGAYNILLAASLIQSGHCTTALAGGCEIESPHFHSGFDSMRAYNTKDNETPERASRPYAADRAGFIFAEGAGIVVLETVENAKERGATILGTLRGWGMSSDGTGEMVVPSSDGPLRAMKIALAHAKLSPDEIDYINTHGTSTPVGDVSEVRAIQDLMQRKVPYSSTKGYTGHTISAAGAIEAILTCRMLRGGWIAPSINATPLDAELEQYPPVLTPTRSKLRAALSNSFGFGGTNVSLVLE